MTLNPLEYQVIVNNNDFQGLVALKYQARSGFVVA